MSIAPAPPTARGRRTRAALVRAAAEVFERDGFLDARVTDIAAAGRPAGPSTNSVPKALGRMARVAGPSAGWREHRGDTPAAAASWVDRWLQSRLDAILRGILDWNLETTRY